MQPVSLQYLFRITQSAMSLKVPTNYRLVRTGGGDAVRDRGAAIWALGAGVAGATSGFADSRWIEVTT
ncbi:MAG: hypothetical protein ACK52S_22795, partial [Pirellula sp.]